MLRPVPPAEDAWFWTPAWQVKERGADVQIRAGQGIEFSCVEDFIDHLKLLDQEAAAGR
jgi:hypothetical protein